MTLIGFDFSINKPAACIYQDNNYKFVSWPYGIKEDTITLYRNSGITIIDRTDSKDKGDSLTSKMRYEVDNSRYLANLIRESLLSFLNRDTYIAFEGLSYASSGDVVLQLGGYKYMLMHIISDLVPLDHMYTYSPITVKSVAGCAKKGMGKPDMINAFIEKGPNHCKFRIKLYEHPELFKKKGGISFIDHLDDFVDSYWVLETLRVKENLSILT